MCVKLKVSLSGKKDIEQAFNPISTDDTPGEMTILVKVGAVILLPEIRDAQSTSLFHIITLKTKSTACLSSFFTSMCKDTQGDEPF